MSDEEEEKQDYNLKKSVEKLGPLVPILKSKRGEIVDGNHRLEEAPDAFKDFAIIIDRIDTPAKEAIVRLTSNFCRRKMKVEERTFLFDTIARETGWDALTIAENTGISVNVVRRFLSPEFKQLDKAHRKSVIDTESDEPQGDGSVETRQVSTSEAPQKGVPEKEPVHIVMKQREICPNCGLGLDYPEEVLIKGKPMKFCMDCAEEFRLTGTLSMLKLEEEQPETTESAQPLAPYSEQVPNVEMEPVMAKEASMIEIRIAKRLTDLKIGFEYHKSFAAPPTTPTFYFPRKNVAIYLERVTTNNAKKTREDLVRGIWERLYDGRVITVQYTAQTRDEEAKAWSQVAEALNIKTRAEKST